MNGPAPVILKCRPQGRIGLNLRSSETVDTLVVDHVEVPTVNYVFSPTV